MTIDYSDTSFHFFCRNCRFVSGEFFGNEEKNGKRVIKHTQHNRIGETVKMN